MSRKHAQEDLLNRGLFVADLAGYAASAAAAELITMWAGQGEEKRYLSDRLDDVDDVIRALTEWRRMLAQENVTA